MQGEGPYDHEGASSEESESFDIRSLLAILRRRRNLILLISLPLLIPASLLPFVLPKSYEATATIEFEKRAPVLELGPDVLADGMTDRTGAALEASVITLATSEAVLGRVLDAMPPQGQGSLTLQQLTKKLAKRMLGEGTPTPAQERQLRLDLLRQALKVTLQGAGDYALITAKAPNAGQAAAL